MKPELLAAPLARASAPAARSSGFFSSIPKILTASRTPPPVDKALVAAVRVKVKGWSPDLLTWPPHKAYGRIFHGRKNRCHTL